MKSSYRPLYVLFLGLALFLAETLRAASATPVVDARFSADTVLIGDQFDLVVTVEKDQVTVIDFPVLPKGYLQPSATQGLEVLDNGTVDTLKTDGRRITLRKSYRMTSFDEGDYHSGHFPVMRMDKNIVDTLWSHDSLHLVVNTIPVDTVKQKIHDVKAPLATPLRFGEFSGYLFGGLGVLAALALAIYLIVRWLHNKPLRPTKRVIEPPHVIAIRALDALHDQKLWQSGRHKSYYTHLTDILRTYLCARFPIQAMEMTSEQIIDQMRGILSDDKSLTPLSDILRTADFVKFAKFIPDGELNEAMYTSACNFVELTKPVEAPHSAPTSSVSPSPEATPQAASSKNQNQEKA